jgi:hypothetical protein
MNNKIKHNFSILNIFGIFLILIGFLACDRNVNEELIEYVITNDSDYDIEIIPIKSVNFRDPKSRISIKSNGIFSENRLWNERFDNGQGFSTFLATDSVNIIIGNERKIIYSRIANNGLNNCDDSRNILRTYPEIGSNRVEYNFTNDDFDCAIICQDECI